MAALDAVVRVEGKYGARSIPITEFHRLPGDTPWQDTNLKPDELITAVDLPNFPAAQRSLYRKIRDRASYAFALVSVAAVLEVKSSRIQNVRLALGGVAHKPWRALAAEGFLAGRPPDHEIFRQAAELELQAVKPLSHNAFKIELAKRTIVAVLMELADEKGTQ